MASGAFKTTATILAVVALLAIGAGGYYFAQVAPRIRAGKQEGVYLSASERPPVGRFGFETENGSRQLLAGLKGKVVVVDVWATWCATCIYSMPSILALCDKYRNSPVEIIGLDVDDAGWAKVRPFLQKHPAITYTIAVPYPACRFRLRSIIDLEPLGAVSAIPTTFVIDRQGKLAGKFVETGHERDIDGLIAKLLYE